MKPNIFMSYSRRELGFVDDLTHELEKAGFKVWLDYRALIPGSPWAAQIDKGLEESNAIVLVVSKASLASKYVELEWRRVINEKNKRIILAIFEAVDLPPELERFEWVDFRGNYKRALHELITQLNAPTKEDQPAPETGFKVPLTIWIAAGFSLLAGFYSLFAFWTILLPVILVPLAWRVFKRDYNFQNVQNALWVLPFSLVMSLPLFATSLDAALSNNFGGVMIFAAFSMIAPFALIVLFRSSALQRWGKPEALTPKFANLYKPNNPNPEPVSFYIDHARQDKRIATDLMKTLTKYGHIPAADIASAKAVFAMISRFKTDTEADPEKQVVFPLLVQTAEVSKKLLHIQWIDFRKGARNMDAIAQLLPNPANMLKALGARPADGKQIVTPGVVTSLINFLALYAALTLSSYPINILQLGSRGVLDHLGDPGLGIASVFIQQAIASAGIIALCFFMIRALIQRVGGMSSPGKFLMGCFLLFALTFWLTAAGGYLSTQLDKIGISIQDSFDAMPIFYFVFIGMAVALGALFRIRDLLRWFPARAK